MAHSESCRLNCLRLNYLLVHHGPHVFHVLWASTGDSKEVAPSKLQLAQGQTLKLSMVGVSPEKQHAHNSKKKAHLESDAEAFAALALPPSSQNSSASAAKLTEASAIDTGGVSGSNDEGDDDDDWGDFTAADAPSSTTANTDAGTTLLEAEKAGPSTGDEPVAGAAVPVVAKVNADAKTASF